jgi:molybdopterin synthase catalytic subunit
MIRISEQPIDPAAVLDQVRSPQAGAIVVFLGTAREFTDGRRTASLEYECYPEMAVTTLRELEIEARRRWPLVELAVVHRVGHVELGEVSVAIAVSSAHRQAAFEAGQWLIDTIKHVVPIWKNEHGADGSSRWVHPESGHPPGA